MMRFKDKVALVTGGATGIGRAICLKLAGEGANVAVADLDLERAKQVAEEIKKLGRQAIAIHVDVTKKYQVQKMVDTVVEKFGKIDYCYNNAGVSTMNPVVDMTEEEWDFNMDVNAKGIFLCCQAEAKVLIKQGFGKIINTASMGGKHGIPFLAHYCASKYAVIGFTKSLALELAKYKINVNCFCPGLVKTEMQDREVVWEAKLRGMTPEEVRDEYIRMTPLGRLETPEDVANIAAFLASEEADFMTGQAINITGGIETN
jgi:meso-butanediol dehydrogenase/(S,S)-butanediol dehydrogenase/diacetyl reductase